MTARRASRRGDSVGAERHATFTLVVATQDYHPPMTGEDQVTDQWRRLLTGEDPSLRGVRRMWRHIPSSPRCKVCASPFHGAGGAVARLVWHGPLKNNPLLCKACFGHLSQHPGGAEIEISVVFADVRGSTGLAERTSAGDYRELIQDYYKLAASAIDSNDGIIDKFLGDGIMALFIPVIAGENHAARAIAAGRSILAAIERSGLGKKGLMVGAGVHTARHSSGSSAATRRSISRRSVTPSTSPPASVVWPAPASCSSVARPGIVPGSARPSRSARSTSPGERAT